MEIMSTNVTNSTRCRGKTLKTPIYFGVRILKVYIMFLLKNVEKFGQSGQKHKKLDFFGINVIMGANREIKVYPIVTI